MCVLCQNRQELQQFNNRITTSGYVVQVIAHHPLYIVQA